MYICVCKAVTDSQIRTAIEQGMCTRKKLTHCFGLGKDCGKCNQEVNALLEQNIIPIQQFPDLTNQTNEIPGNNLFEAFQTHKCQNSINAFKAI
jgi:bacterioferritin-associated ferredoxin